MAIEFTLKTFINAPPSEVYDAWLNSEKHGTMIGASAMITPETGSEFSAWDGYITGKNLELVPDKKIVQSWRTIEFMDSDEDSILEVRLAPVKRGCEITLIHSNIPDNQPDYAQGWAENYFDPMREYFLP